MRWIHLIYALEVLWPLQTVLSFTGSGRPWCQQQTQSITHQTPSQQRSIMTHTQLYAAKMVFKWRVLPSGSLTGICDDGIITTSALQEPAGAKANAIVTTASGSQYKLIGDPVGGKSSFTTSMLSSKDETTNVVDSALTTISIVALVVISGIFAVVVSQKLGWIGSASLSLDDIYSMKNLSGRTIALILYTIGITIATIQLINAASKLSKN